MSAKKKRVVSAEPKRDLSSDSDEEEKQIVEDLNNFI